MSMNRGGIVSRACGITGIANACTHHRRHVSEAVRSKLCGIQRGLMNNVVEFTCNG